MGKKGIHVNDQEGEQSVHSKECMTHLEQGVVCGRSSSKHMVNCIFQPTSVKRTAKQRINVMLEPIL